MNKIVRINHETKNFNIFVKFFCFIYRYSTESAYNKFYKPSYLYKLINKVNITKCLLK